MQILLQVIFALIGLKVSVSSARTPKDWANDKPIFQTNKELKDIRARVPRLGNAFTSTCLKEMNVVVENAMESLNDDALHVENDQVNTEKLPRTTEIEDSNVDLTVNVGQLIETEPIKKWIF
ncbi:hypothetical protein GHT06_010902 [Daphnia sinensis]|uniref:Uncharacterized protein n=1 Tax=Daphnia sinensis TaxID=1820382 RepID=A0AAD5L1B6_9CRUS|nr:hypothetical protein GHT06_010902 [Daphnia sinensis]